MLTPITLTSEYKASRNLRLTNEELRNTNLMAIEAAFVDDAVKLKLRQTVIEAYSVHFFYKAQSFLS